MLLRVPSLEAALNFYRDRLGLKLSWRRGNIAVGLKLRESDSELVLVEEAGPQETDLLVDSADDACRAFEEAGGRILRPPFEIAIGRCAAVEDPWGNSLVLLDMTKGPLKTDEAGNVIE